MEGDAVKVGPWSAVRGRWFHRLVASCLVLAWHGEVDAISTNDARTLILVVGAAGEPQYGEKFAAWAEWWKEACARSGFEVSVIGEKPASSVSDKDQLLQLLNVETAKSAGELWLVMIGHGTFDGHDAKFNLRGPDVSAAELAAALKPCIRPLAIVQCASASGPFLPALSAPGRVVIVATRSGYEVNATRLGGYLAQAIADPAADLDKDGQTSLLEAFLLGARQTDQFYREAGRLATEHALIDDNGDGLGTPADWFHGVHATRTAAGGKSVDGVRAHQWTLLRGEEEQKLSREARARRDELEQQLAALRLQKSRLEENLYYDRLEKIVSAIAALYLSKAETNVVAPLH